MATSSEAATTTSAEVEAADEDFPFYDIPPQSSLKCTSVLSSPPGSVGHGENRLVYNLGQPAWQCAFSSDGLFVAASYGAPSPCIRIWKRATYAEEEAAQAAQLASGEVLPGEVTTTTQPDPVWKFHAELTGIHERTVRSLQFAPIRAPTTLASASFDGTVAIWYCDNDEVGDDEEWNCSGILEGHQNEVKCVRWNATGSLLATCGRDKTVWIWETFLPGTVGGGDFHGGDFECLAVLHGHDADVKCVRFAPSHGEFGDGDEIILSAGYDCTVKIWAEEAGEWYCAASLANIHESTIWSLAVAPGGTRLVTASADGSVSILKCYTAAERKQLALSSEEQDTKNNNAKGGLWKCVGTLGDCHSGTDVYSIDIASAKTGHARMVSGGADNRLVVYREVMDSTSDRPQFTMDASAYASQGEINAVVWHPFDGSLLASAHDDGTVRVWRYDFLSL